MNLWRIFTFKSKIDMFGSFFDGSNTTF